MKRKPSAGDAAIEEDRKDPIAFLRRRAGQHAPFLRLRPEWIAEGIALVVETLGEEWLRAECARRGPVMHRLDHGHDIVRAFNIGDASSVVRVLELGLYVKHLRSCPGFPEIPPQLRNDFESTRLQLAFAHRIRRQGPQVRLEPEAAAGRKGDIAFRWAGREYLVECYARQRKRDPLLDFFSFSPMRIQEEEVCRRRKLRILVRFKRAPNDAERLALERRIRELCRRTQPECLARFEDDLVSVEVQDIATEPERDFLPDGRPNDDGPYSDSHALLTAAEVPVALIMNPQGPGLLRDNGTRMLVWRPPGPAPRLQERISELADRIERKLVQTRSASGTARRVIIAQLEPGKEGDARHQALLRGLAKRILKGHADIAALLVCAREWGPSGRFRYVGTVLPGSVQDELPTAIMRWSAETDYLRDLLLDWNR